MRAFPQGQGFTVGLLAALLLAWLWPEGGTPDGPLKVDLTAKCAVVLIFFLQGLGLSVGRLGEGLADWRLHLFVQGFIFALFPAVALGLVATGLLAEVWAPGFLFLAILPTTISTSVTYASAANGDAASATFNATASNLLAIFLVPAWCAWQIIPRLEHPVSGASTEGFLLLFLGKASGLIVAPLVVGLLVRKQLKGSGEEGAALRRNLSFGCVLFIAYAGFCQGFVDSGEGVTEQDWWIPLAWSAGLLGLMTWLAASAASRLPRRSRVSALFCSSQKSLAVGLPMGQVIFGIAHPQLFELLLPLILYHMLQLFLGSLMLNRLAAEPDA